MTEGGDIKNDGCYFLYLAFLNKWVKIIETTSDLWKLRRNQYISTLPTTFTTIFQDFDPPVPEAYFYFGSNTQNNSTQPNQRRHLTRPVPLSVPSPPPLHVLIPHRIGGVCLPSVNRSDPFRFLARGRNNIHFISSVGRLVGFHKNLCLFGICAPFQFHPGP